DENAVTADEPAPKAADVVTVAAAPAVPKGVREFWLRPATAGDDLVYYPHVLGVAELTYSSARYKVETDRECLAIVEPAGGAVSVDFDTAQMLALTAADLATSAPAAADYAELPPPLTDPGSWKRWRTTFKRWLRNEQPVRLWRSATRKMTSTPAESEADFRIRLKQAASEHRDRAVAKLRKRYAAKKMTLDNRLLRAEQAIERETEQSRKKKLDTAVSFGAALLGAVLGRKRISATSASRIGSAVKNMGSIGKEAADIERATETRERVVQQLEALSAAFEADVAELDDAYDAAADELTEILIKPKSADIEIHALGLGWVPFRRGADGRLSRAI
ncbi:MAG: hypothetical protein AAFX58_10965, partial [Pseudomonadota bacterium]